MAPISFALLPNAVKPWPAFAAVVVFADVLTAFLLVSQGDAPQLIARADAALYRAKANGRDCCETDTFPIASLSAPA